MLLENELSSSTSAELTSNNNLSSNSSSSSPRQIASSSSTSSTLASVSSQFQTLANPLASLTPNPQVKSKLRNATMVIPWRKSIKRGQVVNKRTKDDLVLKKPSFGSEIKNASSSTTPNINNENNQCKHLQNSELNLPKIELSSSIPSNSKTSGITDDQLDFNNNSAASSCDIAKRERRDSGVGGSLSREIEYLFFCLTTIQHFIF